MINIDKIDDGLPVSVIVPYSPKRKRFFEDYVLPMIEANNVNEIIVNSNTGTAPKKRNDGFKKSTQPYIFFCDDDIVLPANHIENLYNELLKQEKAGNNVAYTYSGYRGIVLNPATHPMRGNFAIPTEKFNPSRLKQSNFISTMSLINREHFPMFDESLKRFQDWDIWLNLLINKGLHGKEVFNNEFFAYYLDEGITSNNNNQNEAMKVIIKKYKL